MFYVCVCKNTKKSLKYKNIVFIYKHLAYTLYLYCILFNLIINIFPTYMIGSI